MLHISFSRGVCISVLSEDSSEMTELDLDFCGNSCCQRPQSCLLHGVYIYQSLQV